jgi:hypothetical protein
MVLSSGSRSGFDRLGVPGGRSTVTWMTKKPFPSKVVALAAILVVDLVFATFAWRDLRNRTEDQVRGSKRLWHVAILANPGNSIAYWLMGRKKSTVLDDGAVLETR